MGFVVDSRTTSGADTKTRRGAVDGSSSRHSSVSTAACAISVQGWRIVVSARFVNVADEKDAFRPVGNHMLGKIPPDLYIVYANTVGKPTSHRASNSPNAKIVRSINTGSLLLSACNSLMYDSEKFSLFMPSPLQARF